MSNLTYEELVERARADDRVVGLFLGGSRGKNANVRPDSDYDVRIVGDAADCETPSAGRTSRSRSCRSSAFATTPSGTATR